jgi:hypothetical protein
VLVFRIANALAFLRNFIECPIVRIVFQEPGWVFTSLGKLFARTAVKLA